MQFLRAATQPVFGSHRHAHDHARPRTAARALARRKALLLVAAAVLLGAVATGTFLLARPGSSSPVTLHRVAPGKSLAAMGTSLQAAYSAAAGRENPAYAVRQSAGALAAANPAQGLHARFAPSWVSVSAGAGRVAMQLRGIGYGSSLQPLTGSVPSASGNRVSYSRPGLQDWYANGPLGIEQGFTVAHAPVARPAAPLTLAIGLSGNTRGALEAGGHGLVFSRAGKDVIRYTGLTATDARGHALKSWMSLAGGQLLLHVDAAKAPFPIRIDPFLQEGEKLTGTGESGRGEFGWSVALSSSGNTAIIGGPTDDSRVGAAWVFTRSGSNWTQQGEKLTGGEEIEAGEFGSSVKLSDPGTTALIGGSGDNTFVGAAWVFTESGGKWLQQGKKLTGGGESGRGEFGASASLSANGEAALIGGPRDESAAGAVWAFKFSAGKWVQQGGKLTGGEETGAGEFGWSVGLDSAGETAVIGGPSDNGSAGAAWVFEYSGTEWLQQGKKLTGTGESGKAELGWSSAISGDGTTALVGGPEDNAKTGAAWVFVESGGEWSQQGEKLTGSGESGAAEVGYSVALASGAETAIVGGFDDAAGVGAAWVFTRSAGKWSQQGEKLVANGEVGDGDFGNSVAVSSEGNTALVGAPLDNAGIGAAWVFIRTGAEWSQQGGKLTGGSESGEGEFGHGVALSSDGNTALVGGPQDSGGNGAAWVFTRSAGKWTQDEKITGSGETGNGRFGWSVALSANGDTALVGGEADKGFRGAAWVFTQSGGHWSQQGGKLTGTGESGNGEFGYGVTLSSAGTTAVIGAPEDGARQGAAFVFKESGGSWAQEGEKLTPGSGEPEFGWSVAVSAEGTTALIGGPREAGNVGAAWVFVESAGKWTQQGEKLTGTGEIGNGEFGYSVALGSEGNTALVGGPEDNSGTGAMWVFSRSAGKWAQQGGKVTGTGEVHKGDFGWSIALSPNGLSAVVGGKEDNHGVGGAWVFESATLQWHGQGEVFAEGTPQLVTTKGKLTLHLANHTSLTCKLKDKETLENPHGGAPGVDQTTEFTLSGCKATEPVCVRGEKLSVVPGGLPWSSELVIGPPIRDHLAGVELTVECTRKGVKKTFDVLTGSLTPEVGNSVFVFAGGSGELAESLGGKATITGEDTLKGPRKHKIITG